MNIIITETFKKDFLTVYKSDLSLYPFCEKLKISKLINLKSPFLKYKLKSFGISIRGVVFFGINNNYIPVFISKKSNKKYGMNLVLDKKLEEIVINKLRKSLDDFKNDRCKLY